MNVRVNLDRIRALAPHGAIVAGALVVLAVGTTTAEHRVLLLLGIPVAVAHFVWGPLASAALTAGTALAATIEALSSPWAYMIPLFLAAVWGTAFVSVRSFQQQVMKLTLARSRDEVAHGELRDALEEERDRIAASRRRIERFHMLTSVAAALSSTLDLHDVAAAALQRTRELTGQVGEPRLVVFDEQGSKVCRLGSDGLSVGREDPDALCVWIRERNMPVFVDDLTRDLRFRGVGGDLPGVRGLIAAPMAKGRSVSGVLVVQSPEAGVFSQDDWRLLSHMADLTSVAIQNALLYQRTQEEAITDGLTEVYVHRFFQERLVDELRRARERGSPLILLMADIDNFKSFNDSFGHLAGDAVLKRIAKVLRDGVRATDLVARYGGEEFAVLLVETGREPGLMVAERLRSTVAAQQFRDIGLELPVTVSVGLAEFPAQASDERTLIEKADEALYAAKRGGKNRVVAAG